VLDRRLGGLGVGVRDDDGHLGDAHDAAFCAAPADIVEDLKAECDVVVVGVGDCGSCSASAVADGLQLEAAGIPTVVLVSDAFRVSADAMAALQGTPGYSYVTTPHPVASLTREGVHGRAEQALPELVALLTGHGDGA